LQINKLIRLYNKEETSFVAESLLVFLKSRAKTVIFLKGNLGSGKTTFSQILLQKLGVTERVKSPTYSVIEPYATPEMKIYHLDLYRLQHETDLYEMGLLDHLDENALFLIEWPELLQKLGLKPDLCLEFALNENQGVLERSVIMKTTVCFNE
jgi:tRNA threonylcarbamoyladenosine biosynthesis protein TsaE